MTIEPSNFEEYKREIFDFERFDSLAKEGFEERLGDPTELPAIIGLISIAFNDLENRVSEGIREMLQVENEIGDIISSELSFKVKVHIFSSLVKKLEPNFYFNRLQEEGFKKRVFTMFDKSSF